MQMKQELRQIFGDLSNGKLSQQEALDKIKAIKLQEADMSVGVLFAAPEWQDSDVTASTNNIVHAENHVILCELPKVDAEKLRHLLPQTQCLSLYAGQDKNIAQRYCEYAVACFERIQAILQDKPQGRVFVHIVVASHQEQVIFSGLSGLLKTAALENSLIGQLIRVPVDMTTEELAQRLQEEKSAGLDALIRDSQIRYESGVRQVLRWREVEVGAEKPPIAFKDRGIYVITGGFGGLGVLFAKEILAQTRDAHVILTGRSPFDAEKQSRLNGLCTQSNRLSYRQMDLGDLGQVRQVIAAIKDEYGQLNGILHAAGMAADNFITKK